RLVVADVLAAPVAVGIDAQGLVTLAEGLAVVLLRGGPRDRGAELPRIAALAGSEAAASARKLETLIVTRAYRFNRLSFRPSATPAMCPTDQPAGGSGRLMSGSHRPILSQPGGAWQRTHQENRNSHHGTLRDHGSRWL